MKNEKLKPHKATLDSLLRKEPKHTPDSLLGVMKLVGEEREEYRKALQHIANTSDNYESKYAKAVLDQFASIYE